ncbi:MAG: hypothetical protein ACPLQP_08720 [Moorellaceae bacterium]
MLAAALLISLFCAFYFLLMPKDNYSLSPAQITVSKARTWLVSRLAGGEKKEILALIGRNVRDVLKASLLVGTGLGFLVFVFTVKFLGLFSLVLAFACGILGVFFVERSIEAEYNRWRSRLLDGVPDLVGFFPAFLEVEGVTTREALEHTEPFLREPLRSEVKSALISLKLRGKVDQAVAPLVKKASHPLVDAICLRLTAAWDAGATADIFSDLMDQVEDLKELAAARATATKTGYLALVSVLGLIGMMLVFGYPGFRFLMDKLTGAFGI